MAERAGWAPGARWSARSEVRTYDLDAAPPGSGSVRKPSIQLWRRVHGIPCYRTLFNETRTVAEQVKHARRELPDAHLIRFLNRVSQVRILPRAHCDVSGHWKRLNLHS